MINEHTDSIQIRFNWGTGSRMINAGGGGRVARTAEGRGVCRDLMGKPERQETFWKAQEEMECNIKMDFQETNRGVDWIRSRSGKGQVLGCCGHCNGPSVSTVRRELFD
jgi:hypothetical protein